MGRDLLIWSLKDLKEVIKQCVLRKFDVIIFIEGNRGLGKSTLAFKLLSSLDITDEEMREAGFPEGEKFHPFRAKRDIVYTREDTLKHLATKKHGVIFSDEMINVAYNRDFYQEEQKTMLKALNMYRDSGNVFVGCIPSFIELDKQVQRLCRIRITCVRRGVALIHSKIQSMFQSDSWDVKNNQRIESKWALKRLSKPHYAQISTIKGILKFGDISPSQREEYEAIKQEKRGQVFGKYNDNGLMTSPEQMFLENLYKQVTASKLTPESFKLVCEASGKDSVKMQRKMNDMLKAKGEEKRFKDYVMDEKKKERKDKLGFVIASSNQAREQPTLHTPSIEDNDNTINNTDEEEGEQEDIFGLN